MSFSDHDPFAHSTADARRIDWERLADHLNAVGRSAGRNAATTGAGTLAECAGLLHDIGKAKPAFQAYLRGERGSEPHSGEGARYACEHMGGLGKLLAYCIAGHHAGLANGIGHSEARPPTPLDERIRQASNVAIPDGIALPDLNAVPAPLANADPGQPDFNFRLHFFTRMLFSALVDADFLETEAFYDRVEHRDCQRAWSGTLAGLTETLDAHLAGFGPPQGTVNTLRAEILAHARRMAHAPPGLFSLTVPTGGGKTLTSLAFALDHARRHGLDRVIHVIPYTSIVEQTAEVFRAALADGDAVLEHQSSFDWEGLDDPAESERLRLAAQNWDRPVIVTTAVQFFESLYANRPSKCRKLHRLARSVIVLDEAQTLPLRLLRPCLAAVAELARGYGSSVVFCTATQPALMKEDGFAAPEGLSRAELREIAPDPTRLYQAFRRVRVTQVGTLDDATLAERISDQVQVLVILNNTRHTRALHTRICDLKGARHLSTRMTAAHRRAVLADVRVRLEAGAPVRLIATSLIEAGVDVDFPQVWREVAGIDSIAQAAGRCNREGRAETGEVFVFRSTEDFRPPADLRQFAEIGAEVLAAHDDPLSLAAVRTYFRQLYWDRGIEALDATEVGAGRGILSALQGAGNQMNFPFADIAAGFRMIPEGGLPLIVRGGEWGVPSQQLTRLGFNPHAGAIARAFQRHQVQVPRRVRHDLLRLGAASIWREVEFGEQFVLLENPALYDEMTGFSAENPEDLGALIA